MVIRVCKQNRAVLLLRNLACNTEQPLLRNYANSREPRRVRVQSVSVCVRMRVCRDVSQSRDAMRRRGDVEQRRLQGARGHRQCRLRQHRKQERERMGADADRACDE